MFGLFEFSLVIFAVLLGAAQQFEFLLPFEVWDRGRRAFAGPGHLHDLGLAAQAVARRWRWRCSPSSAC